MSLVIRDAVRDDVPLILRFIRDLADYERLRHEAVATEADIDRELFGPHPKVFCQIATWNWQPAGFALWFYTFSTFVGRHGIWLEDLFVAPDQRGHGIDKALLTNLAARCSREGLGRLEWAVLDWNTPAIEFYQRLGARAMTEWTVHRLAGEAIADVARQALPPGAIL